MARNETKRALRRKQFAEWVPETKLCKSCGAPWTPRSFEESRSRSRCGKCLSAYVLDLKRRKAGMDQATLMNRPCSVCGKPVQDDRLNTRKCPEHTMLGMWKNKIKAIDRQPLPTEEEICLYKGRRMLADTKQLLKERSRAASPSPKEESEPPSTSPQ